MGSFIQQCKFETLRQVRNRRFFFFTILIPIFFYVMFVQIGGGKNLQIGGTTWSTYYMVSMATFSVVGGALNGLSARVAFERSGGWFRLTQTTPLLPMIYVLAKVVSQLLVNTLMILLVFLTGVFVEGVRLPLHAWVIAYVWLVVGALPFVAMGIFIGLIAGKEAAQIVASAVYFILSILGGLWFPTAAMPLLMRHIAYVLPTYRLAHVAWQVIANGRPGLLDIAIVAAYFVGFVGLTAGLIGRVREIAV